MSITVLKAGLQTTLQGTPYTGHRHIGMPAAGAADCLSLALANFLVGKEYWSVAIEIALTDAEFAINEPCLVGVVGGAKYVRVNGIEKPQHKTLKVFAGDELHIGPSGAGCRTYLAISAEIQADGLLDGQSTYLAAGLGGFRGRALKTGDILAFSQPPLLVEQERATPDNLQPHYSDDFVLRITPGPESDDVDQMAIDDLCRAPFSVGKRANRMGLALTGSDIRASQSSNMPSAAVFPGTIQLPPSGQPYLLGPDAQTTGGYPRIAQVIRADRHLIGQMGPGSRVQFVQTTTTRATEIYREKLSRLSPWLGPIRLW